MLTLGLGMVAGILIGAAGIGGVILVPALIHLAHIDVHAAIAAATMSYIATGLVGTALYDRAKSIKWQMTGFLSAGAIPTALAGALVAHYVSGDWLQTAIALLAASSGMHTLLAGKGQGFLIGGKVTPTLPLLDPGKERRLGWWIKVSGLPIMYWNYMLKGYEWFPRHNTEFKEPAAR